MDANTWLWVLTVFLGAIFVGTGLLKLTASRERLVEAGMGWAGGFSQGTIRLLGVGELLGAAALVLPGALDVVGVLVPVSAACLAVGAAAATVVHLRRGEVLPDALRALALVVLCALVAAYRFGPEAF